MNSHSSSSCLMAAIAIFVTVTAVCGAPFVSPPAKIAGHNANSSFHQEVVGAESRITDGEAITTTLPIMFAHEGDTLIQCCYPHGTVPNQSENLNCNLCNTMCHTGTMDAQHNSHLLRSACRCHIIAPCPHFSFVINKALYGGANRAPKNVENHDNVSVVHRRFAASAGYQLTFLSLSMLSWFCMGLCLVVYFFLDHNVHRQYVENITVSIASFTYITLITEYIRQSTAIDIKSSGIEVPDKPNILTALIPGLISISFYLYLFKDSKIQNSLTYQHPLSFYKKQNQILKISKLMLAVDCVYILDIIMGWDFTGIHILHLLKPCQGILLSYVLLFQPFAPVLYNKLLKCLRRRERSSNEVTADPIYTITTV